jgi:hypothetical protein
MVWNKAWKGRRQRRSLYLMWMVVEECKACGGTPLGPVIVQNIQDARAVQHGTRHINPCTGMMCMMGMKGIDCLYLHNGDCAHAKRVEYSDTRDSQSSSQPPTRNGLLARTHSLRPPVLPLAHGPRCPRGTISPAQTPLLPWCAAIRHLAPLNPSRHLTG